MLAFEILLFLIVCGVGVGGYLFGKRDGFNVGYFVGRNEGQRPFLASLEQRSARRQ